MKRDKYTISPEIDKFVCLFLEGVNKYQVGSHIKNIINYIVYLLLNSEFQEMLKTCRRSLGIPLEGFKNEQELTGWEKEFKDAVEKYKAGEKIDSRVSKMINLIKEDVQLFFLKQNKKLKTIPSDEIFLQRYSVAVRLMWECLNLKDTKNYKYWNAILTNLLTLGTPKYILASFEEWEKIFGKQQVSFERGGEEVTNLVIPLYPDTTINDLEQSIEDSREEIKQELGKLKKYYRQNTLKVKSIQRDYFVYKTYLDVLNTEDRIITGAGRFKKDSKIRLDDTVQEKASQELSVKEIRDIEEFDSGSIRQIVSKMKKRINKTVPEGSKSKLLLALVPT